MPTLSKVPNYLKNVTKSMAFIAADVGKDIMPDVAEFAKSNKDFVKQTYSSIKIPPVQSRRRMSAYQNSKIFQALDYGLKNIKQDLTSGDIYAKAREEKDLAKMAGFDTDSWDDLSEFGISSDWEDDLNAKSSGDQNVSKGDVKIVQSIEGSNAAAAQATISAIIATSENTTKNARVNAAMAFEQNERIFAGVHQDLSAIGATLNSILKLQSTVLTNLDKNISSYQTEALKLDNERNAILKEMLEIQRNQYKTAQEKEAAANKSTSRRRRFSDVSIGGIADLDSYFQNVKDNIKGELGFLFTGGNDFADTLSQLMVTPTRDLSKIIMKQLIPGTMKAAMKNFNDVIGGIFANVMVRINKSAKSGNGLGAFISKVLGIDTSVNRKLDTGKYEKGQVAWDGISRRALTNVIPGYLRRIEAHISGNREIDYNYDTGKWVTMSSTSTEFKRIKQQNYRGATYDLMQGMNSTLMKYAPVGANAHAEYLDAIDQFREYLYDNDGIFYPNESASYNKVDRKNYPLFYKYYSKIATSFRDFEYVEKLDRHGHAIGQRRFTAGKKMQLSRNILEYKDREHRTYRSMEANGTSSSVKLHEYTDKVKLDSAKGISTLETKDKFGNSIFTYLKNINQELLFWRVNYGESGFGGGSGSAGSGKIKSYHTFDNAFKSKTAKSQERSERVTKAKTKKAAADGGAYRHTLLSQIASGVGIRDLRDIGDYRAREYALELSGTDPRELKKLYKEQMGVEMDDATEEIFKSFFTKQFRKANIKSMDDLNRAIDKANANGKNTYEVLTAEERGILGKILNKVKGGRDLLHSIVYAPAEAFSNILYSADRSIYNMFFEKQVKEDGTEYHGFFDMMIGKTSKVLDKLADKINKTLLEPLKKKLGIDDDFKNRFKQSIKDTLGGISRSFVKANRDMWVDPLINSAIKTSTGQKFISKSDTATFAKLTAQQKKTYRDPMLRAGALGGETLAKRMEVVGFTGDINTKRQQLIDMGIDPLRIQAAIDHAGDEKAAHEALNKIYNRTDMAKHAKGTKKNKGYVGNTMLSEGELLFNDSGVSVVQKTGAYKVSKPTQILNSRDSYDLLDSLGLPTPKTRKSIQRDTALENIEERKLFGKNAEGTINASEIFNRNVTADDAKVLINQGKKFMPEMLAGSAIGGGISTILGMFGGPILGAAVGAGATLLTKSKTLQSLLFGKMGADGEREDNGLISKKVQEIAKKYLPDMGKGGLVGITASLFTPIGPVGGLIVGSALGYLKNNEELKEKIFGKIGIGESEKNIIKKMLPGAGKGAAVGAIATLFGGPFGIMGNAAIGAALGMVASTDEFKDGILGKAVNGVRSGGLLGAVKDAFEPLRKAGIELKDSLMRTLNKNILEPIADFVKPAIHALPQIAAWIPRKINDIVSQKFGVGMDAIMKNIVMKPLKILLSPVTKIAGGLFKVATTPFRMLGGVGNSIRKWQMRTMNADYMTADERMAWDTEHGHTVQDSDKFFASIGSDKFSVDQAKSMRQNLSDLIDTQDSLASARKGKNREINKIIDSYRTAGGASISYKAKKAIKDAINKGHPEKIPKILSQYKLDGQDVGLTDDQIKALMGEEGGLQAKINEFANLAEREKRARNLTEDDRKSARSKAEELLKQAGLEGKLDLTKRSDIEKFIRYFDTEISAKDVSDEEKALQQEQQFLLDNHQNIQNMVDMLTSIVQNGIKIANFGDEKTDAHAQEFSDNLQSGMDNVVSNANEAQRRVREAIGADTFDQFNPDQQQRYRGDHRGPIATTKSARKLKRIITMKSKVSGKPIRLTSDAKKYLDETSEVKYKTARSFMTSKWISEILATGPELSAKDIQYFISLDAVKRKVSNRCKKVVQANAQNRYNSIKAIMNMSGADFAMLDTAEAAPGAEPTEGEGPDHHVIGTILSVLGGIGSGILSAGKSIVSGAAKGVKSLFSGGEEGGGGGAFGSAISKIGGTIGGLFQGGKSSSVGLSDTNEVDKANDNRDVAAIGDGFGLIKRKSDGSVEPDTSDSHTKELVNEQNRRQTLLEKLQNAQLKASESIHKAFGDGDVKGKAKKGLGWLGALIFGGLLLKSGILGKLWNNVVKPVWNDHIKPWITDTAWPWVKENVLSPIGNWIMDTALPKVGELIGAGVTSLLENLPTILWNVLKGTGGLVTGILDGITGNRTNVGAQIAVNAAKELEAGRTGETGMIDQNGNALTWEQIAAGDYETIRNNQRVYGTVDENGVVTFKDQSLPGSSYAKTMLNGMAHAFTNPTMGRAASKVISGTSKAIAWLPSKGGLIGKTFAGLTKFTGGALSKPLEWAANLGTRAQNHVAGVLQNRVLNSTIDDMAAKVVSSSVGEAGEAAAARAVQSATKNIAEETIEAVGKNAAREGAEAATQAAATRATSTVVSEVAENAVEAATREAVENAGQAAVKAATEAGTKQGLMARIATKAKELIVDFLNKPAVAEKLAKLANSKAAKAITAFKTGIVNTIDDLITKAATKLGADTVQYIVKHLGVIITVAMAIKDFLIGIDQAEAILGVTEVTWGDKIICGLVNALANLIIVPAIWPGVPKFTQWLYELYEKIFDKDTHLAERQAAADEEYQNYVIENGSTLTKEEYLKREYSISGKVGGWFSDRWQDTKNGFKAAGAWIGDKATKAWEGIKSAGQWVGEKASDLWEGAKSGVKAAGEWIGDKASKAWEGIKSAGSWVGEKASDLWEGAKNGVKAAGEWVGDTASKAWEGAKSVGKSVVEGAKSAGKKVLSWIGLGGDDEEEEEKPFDPEEAVKFVQSTGGGPAARMARDAARKNLFNLGIDPDAPDALEKAKALKAGSTAAASGGYGSTGGGSSIGSKLLDKVKSTGSTILNGAKSIGSGILSGAKSLLGIKSDDTEKTSNGSSTLDKVIGGAKSIGGKLLNGAKSLLGIGSKESPENALAAETDSATSSISDMLMSVPNKLKDSLSKVKDSLGGVFKGIFGKKEDSTDEMLEEVESGEVSVFDKSFWQSSSDNDDSIGGMLNSITSGLKKVMFAPLNIVKQTTSSLAGGLQNIGGWVSEAFSSAGDFLSDPVSFIKGKLTGKKSGATYGKQSNYINQNGQFASTGNSASTSITSNNSRTSNSSNSNNSSSGNFLTGAWNGIKNFFGFGPGPQQYSKQIDPEVAGMRFNSNYDHTYQTIGDSACGPAAAVNVLESIYGRGNAVVDAAQYALSRGYKETDGGTRPEFFTDYFSRNGLSSDISYNRNQVEKRINAGIPTVLMGQDPRGTSNSHPFGRNPHYVTVTGTDGNGHAIVQDPESTYSNQVYSVHDLVRKTTLGVSAYGAGTKARRFTPTRTRYGRGRFGRGKSRVVFIGDSRVVGMGDALLNRSDGGSNLHLYQGSDGNIWCGASGRALSWCISNMIPQLNSGGYIDSNTAVVMMMGVNDMWEYASNPSNLTSRYINFFNTYAPQWIAKGADVYWCSTNPVASPSGEKIGYYSNNYGYGAFTIKNSDIEAFNSTVAAGVASLGVKYVNTYSYIIDSFVANDGLHYNYATYKNIHDYIVQVCTNGQSSAINGATSSGAVAGTSSSAVAAATQAKRNMLLIKGLKFSKDTEGWGDKVYGTGKGYAKFEKGSPMASASVWNAFNGIKIKGIYGQGKYGKGRNIENQDLCVWADISADELNAFIQSYRGSNTPFAGNGALIIQIGESTGMDPVYILAHAANESGWGTSNYAKNRGNYFGIGAFDSNPDNAHTMSTSSGDFHPDGLLAGVKWIKENYYDAGQTTLYLFNHASNGWHNYRTSDFSPEISIMNSCYDSCGDYDSRPKKKHSGNGQSVTATSTNTLNSSGVSTGVADTTTTTPAKRNMLLIKGLKFSKDTEGWGEKVYGTGRRTVTKYGTGKYSTSKHVGGITNRYKTSKNYRNRPRYGRGENDEQSIGQFLSGVLSNSKAAWVLNSFLDMGSTGAANQNTDSRTTGVTTTSSGVNITGAQASDMVRVAQHEADIADGSNKENPDGSNAVKYNDWFYGRHVSGDDYPWCAAFISWVANQAGVPESILPKTAGAQTHYNNIGSHGGSYVSNANGLPGDIALFTDNGKVSGGYHIGIVENLANGRIHTIEGNTSNMVHRRDYSQSSSGVMLARPAYQNNASASTTGTNGASLSSLMNEYVYSQWTRSDTGGYGAYRSSNGGRYHAGIDLTFKSGATTGRAIKSFTSGTVYTTGSNPSGRGYYIIIRDRNGYFHIYQHLNKAATLPTGTAVNLGDTVGGYGNSGASQGNHLHYEVRPPQVLNYSGGVTGSDPNHGGYMKSKNELNKYTVNPYTYLTGNSGRGSNGYKPRSKFGMAKFGRGNEANAQQVWAYLKGKGMSDAAAAGILGNMEHESGVEPIRVQGDYTPPYTYSKEYTSKVDNGSISRSQFANNGPNGGGYGLVQFTYYTLKQDLYDNAKGRNKSIGDLGTQLDTMYQQSSGIHSQLNSASGPDAAAKIFMLQYERPADQSTSAQNNRAQTAVNYYNKFSGKTFTYTGSTGDVVGGSSSSGVSISDVQDETSSIGQFLSNVLSNSKAAWVLNSFLDMSGGVTGETKQTSTTDTGISSTNSGGTISGESDASAYTGNGSNSPLASSVILSQHNSGQRTNKIDTITIHTMAGNLSARNCGSWFQNPEAKASSNYGIGSDGDICLYVEEKNRSWCTSNGANDNRAVTIEVASTTSSEPYACTDAAWNSLIALVTDICKRNGIRRLIWKADKSLIGNAAEQNMTVHRWFANKSCPGEYLYSRMGDIANQVNARLSSGSSGRTSGGNQYNTPVAMAMGGNGFKPRSRFGVRNYGLSMAMMGRGNKDLQNFYKNHTNNGGSAGRSGVTRYTDGTISSVYGLGAFNIIPRTQAEPKMIDKYKAYKKNIYGRGTSTTGRASTNPYATRNVKKFNFGTPIGYHALEQNGYDKVADRDVISRYNKFTQNVHYGRGTEEPTVSASYVNYTALIKQIVNILLTVASNTDKLNTIVTILNSKLNIDITPEDVANAQKGNSASEGLAAIIANTNNALGNRMNTYGDTVDASSMNSIIMAMNAIASE